MGGEPFFRKKEKKCVHNALLLQATNTTSLETSRKYRVAFFDVAKAFDIVWIDGLSFLLHELGIRGKTWCIYGDSMLTAAIYLS